MFAKIKQVQAAGDSVAIITTGVISHGDKAAMAARGINVDRLGISMGLKAWPAFDCAENVIRSGAYALVLVSADIADGLVSTRKTTVEKL